MILSVMTRSGIYVKKVLMILALHLFKKKKKKMKDGKITPKQQKKKKKKKKKKSIKIILYSYLTEIKRVKTELNDQKNALYNIYKA